jgi:hypothetical protein
MNVSIWNHDTLLRHEAPRARPIPAWGEAPCTPAQEFRGLKARPIPTSIPKVLLVYIHAILLQKCTQLILKRLLAMMHFLPIGVRNQRIQIRRPYGKYAIPTLPCKLHDPLRLQPSGRRRFQCLNQIRNCHGSVQTNRKVDMIGDSPDAIALASGAADSCRQIRLQIRTYRLIQRRCPTPRAEHDIGKGQRHRTDYRSGLQPSSQITGFRSWGLAPCWYSVAPLVLRFSSRKKLLASTTFQAFCIILLLAGGLSGCKTASRPSTVQMVQYPPRTTTPPPTFKVFHQDAAGITLVTAEDATDEQIDALIWQLRDAAHAHTFDQLHISQKLVDARDPYAWFHIYRGAKCAAEKYAPGAPPCGSSYHAAGDYTFGGFTQHDHDEGVLLKDEEHQTELWNPDAPYAATGTHP